MTRVFTLYPAIDLKGGRCVRLLHGRMDRSTVYNEDPALQAAAFEHEGFEWIHIVDLDAAFSGAGENAESVSAILRSTRLKTQLGGGMRTLQAVERWLREGATRVILGTAAVRNRNFVTEACKAFPKQIVVGVDARGGRVKTDGWRSDAGHTPMEVVKHYEDQDVAAVIYTDIGRDGALTGVNLEATAALAASTAIPVIASGGVASARDIVRLKGAHRNIEGVVVGRALYDKRLDPADALAAAKSTG